MNLFEELQNNKHTVIQLADQAAEFGWIPKTKSHNNEKLKNVISLEEIKEKLNKDTLTIGVIGQMKCGKSTFLNSFIFENDILPAATSPMTAALSVITYGEKEHIVANFYTKDEWEELKMHNNRNISDAVDSNDESKIKAAKELVSKSSKLGSSLNNFLGKTKEDNFNNLIEYVGADGKYVSITKSVTIYYPKEYLKDVEIVDTPGFNDPIVSREERTKEFLKKADVVIMLLYAGRLFDSTDKDIIFKNVHQCGIGKVLIAINKYDMAYCDPYHPMDENEIKEYTKEEIRKASKDYGDDILTEIINETEPIPFSAEMALLSQLPMSKITSSKVYFDAYSNRHCPNFETSSQKELYEKSHISDLITAVKQIIEKEKYKILFKKPINAILVAGNEIEKNNNSELCLIKEKIENLIMPDSELEEKENNIKRANKKISRKIGNLQDCIDSEIRDIIRKGKYELEDAVDKACREMENVVDNEWSRFKTKENLNTKLDSIISNLKTRKLKRLTDELAQEGCCKIKQCVIEFTTEAEEILMEYLNDFESKDFLKKLTNNIYLELDKSKLFSAESDNDDDLGILESFFIGVFAVPIIIFNTINRLFNHQGVVADIKKEIRNIKKEFNPTPFLELAFKNKDKIIDDINQGIKADLLEPLLKQIQEIRENKDKKESELKMAKATKEKLEKAQKDITEQKKIIESITNSIL